MDQEEQTTENGNRKLRVKLDYKAQPTEDGTEEQVVGSKLTLHYITFAVTDAHKQGLEGQQRRIFGRIQRKLDEAVDKDIEEIELEKAEKDFLRKAFEACKCPAQQSKYFVVLENEIEAVCKNI